MNNKYVKQRVIRVSLLICLIINLTVVLNGCVNNVDATGNNIGENGEFEQAQDLTEYIQPYNVELNSEIFNKISKKYDSALRAYEASDTDEEQFEEDMMEIDKMLRSNGVPLSYYTLSEYVDSIEGMSVEDKEFIINNESQLMNSEDMDDTLTDQQLDAIYDKANTIFERYDVSFDEVLEQIYNENYIYAVFDIDGNNITFNKDKNANQNSVNEAMEKKYYSIVENTRKYIPEDIWSNISLFEFNTDGTENVLAHTVSVDDDYKKYRFAIDVLDTLDDDGEFTLDGKETIVHEAGHIITLIASQVIPVAIDDQEIVDLSKKYKDDSYMMAFYNRFWSDKYAEYIKTKEETEDTIDFYDKYKDEFVSDYAATNPEEDIAESFRVFVFNDKPVGHSVVDNKLKFFYEYDEFVKWRKEFRQNLSLD